MSYQSDWEKFKLSGEYKRCFVPMAEKGIVQPYLNNILQSAFDAGYNSNDKPDSKLMQNPVLPEEMFFKEKDLSIIVGKPNKYDTTRKIHISLQDQ